MEEEFKGSTRQYRELDIPGAVVVRSKKFLSRGGGYVKEEGDFSEISNFSGFRFDVRSLYTIWSPKGVIRGGHMEGRSKFGTVVNGAIFFIMVDMRPGEGQGKVVSLYLGKHEEAWGDSIVVPEGVVDAYVSVAEEATYLAVGNKPFSRFDSFTTLDLFDKKLDIKWPEGTLPQSTEEEMEILSLDDFISRI